MKVLLTLTFIFLSQIYAFNITNSLDGYVAESYLCYDNNKEYYLGGIGMCDIALQYDLKNFTAPVRKATFNLLPYLCFNSDKMRVYLKTSADDISFSRPCKKYDYHLVAIFNIEDSKCNDSVDITSTFNDAIMGNKKLQLFLVDTWIPFCDSIVPGTQQTPSCQINFQGKSDSPSHPSSFQIQVEESEQQTSPVSSTHAPTPATSSVTRPTTTFSIPSETTVQATPSPTSQNNDQAGQNNSSKQERNSAIKELLSISTLMIAAIVLN
jgi:hypothetical protein